MKHKYLYITAFLLQLYLLPAPIIWMNYRITGQS